MINNTLLFIFQQAVELMSIKVYERCQMDPQTPCWLFIGPSQHGSTVLVCSVQTRWKVNSFIDGVLRCAGEAGAAADNQVFISFMVFRSLIELLGARSH